MHPTLATLLTLAGIFWLLRYDAQRSEPGSAARWLPVAWMAITGSRFVSQWLDLGGDAANYTDGSPLDAMYFASLILLGFIILSRRGVRFGDVASANGWLAALALLGLISVAWSDQPDVAVKRWIKTLGHPLVALVILTDRDPVGALRAVLKRCAYILLPLSVLFIKYLPQYGRGFDNWTGQAYNNGVGHAKNDLAMLCMIFLIFFVWHLLNMRRIADPRQRRMERWISIGFIGMALWLLDLSDGATALATVVLCTVTMFAVASPLVSKRYFGTYMVTVIVVAILLQTNFQVYERVVEMLGRNPNLTDRTEVWADVLALQARPLFGYGFESFWLGARLDALWEKWWWRPIQAHNGYIETYLNQGAVGLLLLVALLLSTFRRISRQLVVDFEIARLRLAYLVAVLMFNYTEAAFKGVALMWTIFHIIAMEAPRRTTPQAAPGLRP